MRNSQRLTSAPVAVLLICLQACEGPVVRDIECRLNSDCSSQQECSPSGQCVPMTEVPMATDSGIPLTSDGGATDAGRLVGQLALSPATAATTQRVGESGTVAFTLSNTGTATLHFGVSCTQGASATPFTGAIAVDETVTITVAFPTWGTAGTQTVVCTAQSVDALDASLTFTATVEVLAAPRGVLTLSPATAHTMVQVNQAGSSTFQVGNEGDAALQYAVNCTHGTPLPAAGTIMPGATAAISVNFSGYGVEGSNALACTVTTSDGTGGPLTFTLQIAVTAIPRGHLTLTPTATTDTGTVGQGGSTTFSVGNDGLAALSFDVSCTTGALLSPAAGALAPGASQVVVVTYPVWSSPGTKTVACTATTSDGTGGPLVFTATVVVSAPPTGHLTLSPAARSLSTPVNQSSSTNFTLGNDGTASLNATVTCTLGASAAPALLSLSPGATRLVTVAAPGFPTSGTQNIVCTADPTDTPDASLSFTLSLTVTPATNASPCAKGGIWSDLDGLTGAALRDALAARVIPKKAALSYSAAGDYLHGPDSVDRRDDGTIECAYSGKSVLAANNTFNVEHSWPQSFFNEAMPMKSDLHHLFPTDPTPNSQRANYAFDTVTCTVTSCPYQSGSTCGSGASCTAGGVSLRGVNSLGRNAFEVRLKQRGNTARGMFYFATRYPTHVDSNDSTCYGATTPGDSPRCFPTWEQATLKAWNEQDPVDAAECARNDAIEALQGNRNPFIDRPDFITKIGTF